MGSYSASKLVRARRYTIESLAARPSATAAYPTVEGRQYESQSRRSGADHRQQPTAALHAYCTSKAKPEMKTLAGNLMLHASFARVMQLAS